jgi:hypothetical protein
MDYSMHGMQVKYPGVVSAGECNAGWAYLMEEDAALSGIVAVWDYESIPVALPEGGRMRISTV